MPSIAEATIDLHANVAALRADLAKGSQELNRFQRGAQAGFTAMKAAAAGFISVVTIQRLADFGRMAIEAAGRTQDMADQLRVSAAALQAFDAAANESGVGAETFQAALTRLNESIGEAVGGNKSMIESFADLGVAFKNTDGSARSTEEVVAALAAGYAEASDKTKFLADLTDVMGRSAGRLGPILEQVSDVGIQAFIDKQREAGLVASNDTIRALDALGDEFDRLGTQIKVFAQESIVEMLRFFGVMDRTEINILTRQRAELQRALEEATVSGGAEAHANRGRSPQEIADMRAAGAAEAERLQSAIADLDTRIADLERGFTMPEVAAPAPIPGATGSGRGKKTKGVDALPEKIQHVATLIDGYEHLRDVIVEANEAATERAQMAIEAENAEAAAVDDVADGYDKLGQSLDGIANSLTGVITGTADWSDLLGDILTQLLDFNLTSTAGGGFNLSGGIIDIIGGLFGGAAGGGLDFGGFFAEGGRIGAGQFGIVGESGPELISGPATVTPMGGGGSTFIIDARGADREGFRRLERMIIAVNGSIEERSVEAVLSRRQRGGRFAAAFR